MVIILSDSINYIYQLVVLSDQQYNTRSYVIFHHRRQGTFWTFCSFQNKSSIYRGRSTCAFCHFLSLPAISSHPEVLDLASTGVNPLHTVSSNWPLSVLEVVFTPSMVFSCVQLKAAERGWTKIESELYFLLSCQSIERWKFCICDLSRRNIVHNFTCQQKFPEAAMPAWTRKKCHSTFTNGFQPERPLTSWKVYVLEMFYTKQLQNQYCETVVSFYVLLT